MISKIMGTDDEAMDSSPYEALGNIETFLGIQLN